jgi:Tfp pilus assembly protein PilZ
MATPERRITPRFKLHAPLSFHCPETQPNGERRAKAINISTRGVYFTTDLLLHVGQTVELLLEMPKRVSGVDANRCRFTGRVTHIESKNMPQGVSGIGVQLLYYEIASSI